MAAHRHASVPTMTGRRMEGIVRPPFLSVLPVERSTLIAVLRSGASSQHKVRVAGQSTTHRELLSRIVPGNPGSLIESELCRTLPSIATACAAGASCLRIRHVLRHASGLRAFYLLDLHLVED